PSALGFFLSSDVTLDKVTINNPSGTNRAVSLGTNLTTSGTFTITAGTFNLSSSFLNAGDLTGAGIITNNGGSDCSLTVGSDGNSSTYSGVIQNGPTRTILFTKQGSGTFTLTGTNTFTGGTTLIAGTLAIGNNSALGTGG